MDAKEIAKEKWSAIPMNRCYAVSTLGRVASAHYGRISVISPSDNGKGYKIIKVTTPKRQNFYVHRLVAEAFVPNPDKLKEVNHKDGNKANNRADNLEWVSLQQNRDHAVKVGLIKRGENHPHSKLTNQAVREIRQAYAINPKLNQTALGRKYGVGQHAIKNVVSGQRWAHVDSIPSNE